MGCTRRFGASPVVVAGAAALVIIRASPPIAEAAEAGSNDCLRQTCMNKIDEELLKIMVCPVAHAPLVQVGDWLYSTDSQTRRKYPVRDGIPIMLVDESQVADVEEFKRVMADAGAPDAPTTQRSTTKH
jgi:uncharacterized protein YbaR (Trm112 family)